jgi:carbon monoxide dehydrogenase subunit G
MNMTGERRIAAPKEQVWAALNDPVILQACIPGCEKIDKISETELKATAAVKLGPIAAKFSGKVLLSDLDPPNGYTISGEGQGGVAGHVKGGAKVALAADPQGTMLTYEVRAQIGGKMAQLGARLIDATAKQYAESFFNKFSELVAPPIAAEEPPMAEPAAYHVPHEDHDHDPSNPRYFGLPLGVIIIGITATISVAITLAKFFL